jgi:hypothetical protein
LKKADLRVGFFYAVFISKHTQHQPSPQPSTAHLIADFSGNAAVQQRELLQRNV